MTIEFRLPDIGEGLDEAEIVEWLVEVGDTVDRNQPFVEILTDKSQTEMPAPGAGTIVSLGGERGDIVKVGDVLIVIDDGNAASLDTPIASTSPEDPDAPTPEDPDALDDPQAEEPVSDDAGPSAFTAALDAPATQAAPVLRPKAAPATRRLAAELDISLADIEGSGPGGRILAADVQIAANQAEEANSAPFAAAAGAAGIAVAASSQLGQMPVGTHPLRGVRRATAKAMDLSWSTIPHVTTMDEIDASELLLARARAKAALGERGAVVTPLALMLVATARALRRFPMMNASLDLDSESITVHDDVNLSVAVASERGLMVPVIQHADRLGLLEMATELARVSQAARDGSVTAKDLAGSTFTVSNYGSNGGYFAAPIVRPGESGIVGFGAIKPRPFVIDSTDGAGRGSPDGGGYGTVEARPVLPIVISADHRLIDGDLLSAFQKSLADSLTRAIGLLVS